MAFVADTRKVYVAPAVNLEKLIRVAVADTA